MKLWGLLFGFLLAFGLKGQVSIEGQIVNNQGEQMPFANIQIEGTSKGAVSDEYGHFILTQVQPGLKIIVFSFVGYESARFELEVRNEPVVDIKLVLEQKKELEQVVVSGTMKPMSKTDSPVPVEVYSPAFFKMNPTPSIYESMQNVNGVRPQLNCNVCNTGDIHINGMEGSYTMVLIDGMPIVSGLSTVYGLSGIPVSMIERVEIVKGPASSLYGSEAIGGLINVITKNPDHHPIISGEIHSTSWGEISSDVGFKLKAGKWADVLMGVNMFYYNNPKDLNHDNFTDISLSKRLSIFQKWKFNRKSAKPFDLAMRYYTEERWGGEMDWTKSDRGGANLYGESIYTDRFEIISNYRFPVREQINLAVSLNGHHQDSYYGTLPFKANQYIAFNQLTWNKQIGKHDVIVGSALRYTYYDDNSVATEMKLEKRVLNQPSQTYLPGLFVQDNLSIGKKQSLLLGLRYDYHVIHGPILTPRLAYQIKLNPKNTIRLNAGTGFRVVNVFTEDHAALTGAREVIVADDLKPERSYNVNINYTKKMYHRSGTYLGLDFSLWYGYFANKIMADYDLNPNQIIYQNIDGHSETRGGTFNIDAVLGSRLKCIMGVTYTDIFNKINENGSEITVRPVLTEKWSGTWSMAYQIPVLGLSLDYTGNIYGPMRLPLLSDQDPRAPYSPWWTIQNIQLTYRSRESNWEIFGGVKNLLNYTPPSNSIARSNDPFDKNVTYDQNGDVLATEQNPYAMTFDPSYVFAPNQGIRYFLGLRFKVVKK